MQKLLSNDDLKRLEQAGAAIRAGPGTLLFEIGNDDSEDIVLLEGDIELSSRDGVVQRVSAGSDAARLPIARLRPRRYRGKSVTQIRYLKLAPGVVAAVLDRRDVTPAVAGYEVAELLYGESSEASELFVNFATALRNDNIRLPSLPAVAAKMRTALKCDDIGAQELARIVERDVSIATKLVRVANSPLYRGEHPSKSVVEAVSRVGVDRAQQLVMGFALKEIFKSKVPELSRRMSDVWRHSQGVASAAFLLAREHGTCEPERALLAGLVHDIGVVALLVHAELLPAIWKDAAAFSRVLTGLKAEAGTMLLVRWGFDAVLVQLVKDVDDWRCKSSSECDVLQAVHWCQQHVANGTLEPPAAFARIPGLTVEAALRLTAEAKEGGELFDDAGIKS